MNQKQVLLPLVLLLVAGCSEPTIDASSDQAWSASIDKVRQSLPQEQKAKFDEAVQVLAFSQQDLTRFLEEGISSISPTRQQMKDVLNGKTGEEVIMEAERIKREREENERARL